MAELTAKVTCRTPEGDQAKGTNIPAWKFDLLEGLILGGLSGGPMTAKALGEAIRPKITADDSARLGAFGWHFTTVRLEMEVRGDIRRQPGVSPVTLEVP